MKLLMLRPSDRNRTIQAITRSKAKMYEYSVPPDRHISVGAIPLAQMLDLTIGILGDFTANPSDGSEEVKGSLLFTAQYFNSLLEAEVISDDIALLKFLSASAYYLAGYPGSSQVLLKDFTPEKLEALTLYEQILFAVLKRQLLPSTQPYSASEELKELASAWKRFLNNEDTRTDLDSASSALRSSIYSSGSDRDLLLVDVIRTMVLKRRDVSVRNVLSQFSDSEIELWEPYFSRDEGLKEFWPAQVKLAQYGIFRGASALIQMPTSAGKTRAVEIVIRSAFLSGRASVAVVVAPFRALCQEIYNDFSRYFRADSQIEVGLVSDVLQNDDLNFVSLDRQSILILTPEKLDLLLKYDEALAQSIGLIIYDEGHLFDSDSRGPKYELLLSSLKTKLLNETQVILMSAVISNAPEVKNWLTDQAGVLIDGTGLNSTNRNIALVEWNARNANLRFVNESDISDNLFYVPTVLRSYELTLRERERRRRSYPEIENGVATKSSQIAGYLACRLASSGLSAIFVGRKDSAENLVFELVDAYDRGLPIAAPAASSQNIGETEKVTRYIERLLGEGSTQAKASKIGILMHHGGVPHGLRLVTEHALLNSHFKVVVCTSSLAQGINLPIRYLIIASLYQGKKPIATRDFQNLMGRAGRSGNYTEGTVIFADPGIYETQGYSRSRWSLADRILDNESVGLSESRLLVLMKNENEIAEEEFEDFRRDVALVRKEVVSYLLNSIADIDSSLEVEVMSAFLARSTLGYAQLTIEDERAFFVEMFVSLGLDIFARVPESNRRSVFSKLVLDIESAEDFLIDFQSSFNYPVWTVIALGNDGLDFDLLDMNWRYLYKYSNHGILKLFTETDAMNLCKRWIDGESYPSILASAKACSILSNKKLKIMDVVNLCEQGFGYELSTLLGSLFELMKLLIPDAMEKFEPNFRLLQRRLRYGVSNQLEAIVFELGFCDRDLSKEIVDILDPFEQIPSSITMGRIMRDVPMIRERIVSTYPDYFVKRLDDLESRYHG